MANEDYARGYNDGFRAGLEAGKGLNPSPPYWPKHPYQNDWMKWPNSNSCRVCGMVFEVGKAYGYVCGNSKCPSKIGAVAYSVPDGLSYEEIYGSVVYQQNKKKE